MGFQNFDMTRFGVLSERLKALSEKPEMPAPVFFADAVKTEIARWQGVSIKNMENLSERSATGMDSEYGVYVISVPAYGTDLRDYLQPNDVILGFADAVVNNLDDLRKAIAAANLSKPQKIIIFRSQKKTTVNIPANSINENF
jgi:S1-C subfamily serine protease